MSEETATTAQMTRPNPLREVMTRDKRKGSVYSLVDTSDLEETREVIGPKASALSNLGKRSESMLSVYSLGEARYGTVTVSGEIEFGFIYNFGR